jgi:hypothetical protein
MEKIVAESNDKVRMLKQQLDEYVHLSMETGNKNDDKLIAVQNENDMLTEEVRRLNAFWLNVYLFKVLLFFKVERMKQRATLLEQQNEVLREKAKENRCEDMYNCGNWLIFIYLLAGL